MFSPIVVMALVYEDFFFSAQTHVCIQQTALDLIGRGLEVHIIADSTSSRSMMDRMFALEVNPATPYTGKNFVIHSLDKTFLSCFQGTKRASLFLGNNYWKF